LYEASAAEEDIRGGVAAAATDVRSNPFRRRAHARPADLLQCRLSKERK
jgi:hypothetical protein